jgi:hypothetical protein
MPRLPVRILGVASTTHGFAFVTTDGPDHILDWGKHNFAELEDAMDALNVVVARSQPLFVACEIARNKKRSERGRTFNAALTAVCDESEIMILCVERTRAAGRMREATDRDLAEVTASHFPSLAHMLTRPRRIWDGVDDRIGILLAAASASAGWRHFGRRQE